MPNKTFMKAASLGSSLPQALHQNIKVSIRVKPLEVRSDEQQVAQETHRLSSSRNETFSSNPGSCITIHSPTSLSVNSTFGSVKGDKDFTFDSIFGPSANQEHVYNSVSDLVDKAVEGYNVCVSFMEHA
jgi:kinesin family protein C1